MVWISILAGCTVKQESVQPQTTSNPGPTVPQVVDPTAPITGEWTQAKGGAGGFTNVDSFKNFQYNFEIEGNNQPVAIQLTSDVIDVQYALFNPLGQQIDVQGRGRNVGASNYTLNAGKYRIVVMADRQAVGKFSLSLMGTKAGGTIIPSNLLQSNTQNWGTLGGGGKDVTYKNHFYTFEVTEDNFSIDVEIESPDTDVALYVYDQLGQALNTSYFGDRSKYVILKLNKGTYSVMAATVIRGSVGNYNLRLVGKAQNLQRVESQLTTVKGTWDSKTSADVYSVELTPNTSPLDIELTSPETVCQIDLQNTSSTTLTYTVLASNSNYLLGKNLAKNTYLVKVYPGRVSGKAGTYTLNVVGRYSNFKKI
ncbi:hypothetical protein GCM10028809_56420 [Spirosoma gilvum]